ncbi:MAG: hypothetical protein JXC33_07945 [Deltaproteobacteria bacterium]|nr:hypothetical protein [Deltaproteobacteria bacterium]
MKDTCKESKTIYARFKAKAERIAKENGIELPETYYRYGFCECWKCRKDIIDLGG